MGGKGETVSYTRIRAKTQRERDNLKTTIERTIDNAVTPISIIVLLEGAKGGRKKGSKKRYRRRRKR
jgi:hypothetical protein